MRLTFCIIIVSFFFSCTNKSKVPSDVIAKDKMERIVGELLKIDEYSNNYLRSDSIRRDTAFRINLYQQVFKSNNITKGDYIRSFNFYLGRPDMTKEMFDSLNAKFTREQQKQVNIK